MFKKSRRKIVAAIMSILVLLWIGTLSTIYASSYFEMKNQNQRMLQAHAQMYSLPGDFGETLPPSGPKPGGEHNFNPGFDPQSPMFRLSTFYTVAVSQSGEILEIKNEPPTVHTDEDLVLLAKSILKGSDANGIQNSLTFHKTDKGDYTLVAFMDNTVFNESAMTLFRYTLLFGGIALLLFFFLSVHLARKIVNPLEESYEKQKQFISDAGHELKTPVAVVSANADLLAREMGANKWLQNIQYENERMGMLVTKLLELARTESVTPQMDQINFSRLVAGEALPFESVAFEKGLVLQCEIANDITVEGSATELKQIVSILLDNAIDHSKESGEVFLCLKKERGVATLSVINKGDEIPTEERTHLFERFYRADPTRSSENSHYGLGLAIAKAIATSHKGSIEVRCFDGLVEFKVQIPLQQK